jgi:hypothetical protein
MRERYILGAWSLAISALVFLPGILAAQTRDSAPVPETGPSVAEVRSAEAAEASADRAESSLVPRRPIQQAAPASPAYAAITGAQRLEWVVDGTVGLNSLRIGIVASAWSTAFNTPEEWGRTVSGFAKRYVEREADVAISSTIEAGLGALWGEEPRYVPSRRRGLWPRTQYAMKTVFLAQRRDGHLAPAWGRLAGNVVNNVIENSWLPPSVTTGQQTAIRSAEGFVGRLIGNLWEEFRPDVKKRLPHWASMSDIAPVAFQPHQKK